ncbi:MAG: hypothetical protein AAGF58_15320, partial [Pseudomonadota bacterium]
VQIKLGGKWTTALRLGAVGSSSAQDEPRARRTFEKLVEAGHYEAVRVLNADGQKEGRTVYRLLTESGDLDVTNPVPQKLDPKPRYRTELRRGNKPWRLGKELASRDDAFALALRYHRQDQRRSVRVLEQVGPDKFREVMHRQPSLGGGHHHHKHANENDHERSLGFFGWLMGGGPSGRRRNAVVIVACFIGLMVVSNNQLGAGISLDRKKPEPTLTGMIPAADLTAEQLQEACGTPPEVSVKFFESINVPAADQALLNDYLGVVQRIGSAWSFRQSGEDCFVTLTGGATSNGAPAPTQIDCRIGDFFFTQFGRPAAARAAPGGCRVL